MTRAPDWLDRPVGEAIRIAAGETPGRGHSPSRLDRFLGFLDGVLQSVRALSPPLTVSWELTHVCNLSCAHCYLSSEDDPGRAAPIDTQEALALVAELRRMGTLQVTLSGGEPMVRKDLPTIVAAIKAARMGLVLQTNGTLTGHPRWDALAALLDPRIDLIQVSLDGPDAAFHDRVRGAGSFDATVAGLRRMHARGLAVVISCCPTAANQERLPEIYDLAAALGARAFQATPLAPFTERQDALTPDQAVLFKAEAEIVLRARRPGAPAYLGGVSGELLHWVSFPEARARIGHRSACPETFRCGGLADKLHIASDGMVYPCVFAVSRSLALGNIREHDLSTLWRNRAGHPFEKGRGSASTDCAGCEWGEACKGGCPGLALARTGRFEASDPRCGWSKELRNGARA